MINKLKGKYVVALSIMFLTFGLLLFLCGVYFIDRTTVYIGQKNLFFVALVPTAIFWSFKIVWQKFEIPKYMLIFIVTYLWVLGLACFFFLIVGITTPGLWLTYLASQVLYLGGWIAIFSVFSDEKSFSKVIGIVPFSITILFIVTLLVFTNATSYMREFSSPLYPMPLRFPHFIFELLLVAIGIGLFLSILKSSVKIFDILTIVILSIFFMFTALGKMFFNFISYDYLFFAPFLLSFTLSIEMVLLKLVTRIKPTHEQRF